MTTLPTRIARAQCADLALPGGVLPVAPALAPIFLDLATRYHQTVEPLQWPGCWGWADRNIKNTKTISKHAGGLAIDLCAPAHPQGVPALRTFSREQIAAIAAILARYDGIIEWGGTWDLPSTDGMHFQLRDGVSLERVLEVAARFGGAPAPAPAPPPAPSGPGWTGPDLTGAGLGLRGDVGNNGPRVAAWQAFLRDTYPAYRHEHGELATDGWWGPVTTAWNAEFGHRSGIPSADGRNIGPRLAAAYHRAGLFRRLSAARVRVLGHVDRRARR